MNPARAAALRLSTLHRHDRRWVLEKLSPAAARAIKRELSHAIRFSAGLDETGIKGLFANLAKEETQEDPGMPLEGMPKPYLDALERLSADRVAALLQEWPAPLASALLSMRSWSWQAAVKARLRLEKQLDATISLTPAAHALLIEELVHHGARSGMVPFDLLIAAPGNPTVARG